MIGGTMSKNSQRTLLVTLLLVGTVAIGGCKDIARASLRGAMEKVGARAVEGSSDQQLRSIFESANAACPVQMDAFTTLEGVEMIDDRYVEYRYLMTEEATEIASRIDKRAMKRAAVEHIKGNAVAVAMVERDLVVEHIYEDAAGNHVLSFIINRAVLEGDLEPLGTERSNPLDVTKVKASGDREAIDPVAAEKIEQTEASEDQGPPLPKQLRQPAGNQRNPAGLQTNPFFNET